MFATGMMSSLYESVVWEELTGIESVSTISILAKAQEENIDILLISKNNLDTEIEKLNTDEATKQTVINAVNSGKIVTIPASDITMGDWHGTGYIITNPETGAGAYMISGGLNGGAVTAVVTIAVLCALVASVLATAYLINTIVLFVGMLSVSFLGIIAVSTILALVTVAIIEMNRSMLLDYMDYMFTGNLDSALSASEMAAKLGEVSLAEVELAGFLNKKLMAAVAQGTVPDIGFSTFADLKKYMGSAGTGNAWHHIVEQSQISKTGFAAKKVHNVNNIIAIPNGKGSIHAKISGYYSSIPSTGFTNGLTVRQWLIGKSFDEQFEFGINVLKQYGDVIETSYGWKFVPYN